ncbi:DNA polymerase III subunit chi [Ramlibacter sp. H39-3-26]|uniref:DNA polymerase III subunit chi n=1 Tax=Curvibacter soli TaxID=3031331 RepID=UPI0023DA5CA0|nr:DNA polymerase III subunit chi [Ramlibacter sp. H39-3-26]MDF1485665.1 DNA polymerase III subunit chi [Ramlibacter sp. H39-3-26]
MTEIAFHFNAPDKWSYVCRLLRKAAGSGARVAVVAPDDALQLLDRALWSLAPHAFVPHCMAQEDGLMLESSPIVLAREVEGLVHHDVLVNLLGGIPEGFERFARLVEIVSQDDARDRQEARQRWRHYADRGYSIISHDVVQKGA